MRIDRLSDLAETFSNRGRINRWHAVSIVGGTSACAESRALKDQRYLSTTAPRLPLASCDSACCDCTYRHHEDRRRGPRRASESGGAPKKAAEVERRSPASRREVD